MELRILPFALSVVRLEPDQAIPDWVHQCRFFSVTRTDDELSIFCESGPAQDSEAAVHGWRAFRVVGQLDLDLTGILSALAMPLAAKQISIFSISTHDTDYIVLREANLADARDILERSGHIFI